MSNLFERAEAVMPGGINTVIHNYPPRFATSRASGAYFWDQNGKKYIDYLGAWGPIILGYDYKPVKEKVKAAIDRYDLYGIGASEAEVQMAEKICKYVKGAERSLMCGSGSESTYHAIRLARAYTGRNKIIKMQGAFHGWHAEAFTEASHKRFIAVGFFPSQLVIQVRSFDRDLQLLLKRHHRVKQAHRVFSARDGADERSARADQLVFPDEAEQLIPHASTPDRRTSCTAASTAS